MNKHAAQTPKTIPQYHSHAAKLREMITNGSLPEGNVELAALLGHKPSQIALGRSPMNVMNVDNLIEFLLNDPNLKIKVDVMA